ncbi:Eco57I restriction-modification methylase domain-containing protein [Burkholderia sp. CCA53]|uniref:Eco57I restriction-modification methylase domain-containing protein n=1 Tax=Burkholderia sp. CCA53 TaxID=1776288 RepID=UPI0020C78FE5|nr:hypothetical protein [Burkholderia sp. CCA53]
MKSSAARRLTNRQSSCAMWAGAAFRKRSTTANQDWQDEYLELAGLLSKDEYERARRSTQDAHYTSQTVIEGIYKGLQRIGFDGGRVFEPSAGIGNFIGLMPAPMRAATHFTAIELDPLTAEIARHLYPSATHINRGLQDVVIPAGHFDACVGNPPFGTQSLYDPHHRELGGFSIHNYFLAKSIDKLREGGVMAVVVSRYFLDAANTAAREHIAGPRALLGAIRLPNTAFKRNALTEVTTDIIFFQKAAAGETPDRRWVDVGEIRDHETGEPITISRYFIDILNSGRRMAITSKMHRDAADLVPEAGVDLADAIERRLQALPADVYRPADDAATATDRGEDNRRSRCRTRSRSARSSSRQTEGSRDACRISSMSTTIATSSQERARRRAHQGHGPGARGAARSHAGEQSEHVTDFELTSKRSKLNRVYDDFGASSGTSARRRTASPCRRSRVSAVARARKRLRQGHLARDREEARRGAAPAEREQGGDLLETRHEPAQGSDARRDGEGRACRVDEREWPHRPRTHDAPHRQARGRVDSRPQGPHLPES